MKRFVAILLALCLLVSVASALETRIDHGTISVPAGAYTREVRFRTPFPAVPAVILHASCTVKLLSVTVDGFRVSIRASRSSVVEWMATIPANFTPDPRKKVAFR